MAIVGLTFFWERLEKFHELESARVSDFRPTKSLNLSRILCSISGWYSTVNLSYCRKTRKQPDLHLDEPDWWGFANSNSESLALVAGLYTQQEKSQRSESKCFKALWNPLVFTTKNGYYGNTKCYCKLFDCLLVPVRVRPPHWTELLWFGSRKWRRSLLQRCQSWGILTTKAYATQEACYLVRTEVEWNWMEEKWRIHFKLYLIPFDRSLGIFAFLLPSLHPQPFASLWF